MSQFYGKLYGKARTPATRCGSKKSGIATVAASWAGAIRVDMYEDDEGVERFTVHMVDWEGRGDRLALASGIVGKADSVEVLS